MSETVVIRHKGKEIARTIFNPSKKNNPRAWVETKGSVSIENGITVVDV